MITPTMTLRQKDTVLSLMKRPRYSLTGRRTTDEAKSRKRKAVKPGVTYGVSNMTLHTLAIVLRQSVVFSMGRFLFCNRKKLKG